MTVKELNIIINCWKDFSNYRIVINAEEGMLDFIMKKSTIKIDYDKLLLMVTCPSMIESNLDYNI